ncbi:MAG: heme exporter protein B, partial [Bacteroidia bacterium]
MQSALIHQVKILFLKELRSEFRNRFAINGILLQLVSSIYIVYLSFKFISPNIWSALFWIILLFTTVSGISRSFVQERQGRMLYFHTTVNPLAVLYAKIAFNTLLGLMITAIALLFFTLFMGAPDLNFLWFSALALLFALGLSILLT